MTTRAHKTASTRRKEPRRKLKRAEVEAIVQGKDETARTVLEMFSKGEPHEQIAKTVGISSDSVTKLIVHAVDQIVQSWSRTTPEQNFGRYALFQLGIVKQLQATVDDFKKDPASKQYNAIIAALRAQSDIYDTVFKKGVELQIISHRPSSPEVRFGRADLLDSLKKEHRQLTQLIGELELSVTHKITTEYRRKVVSQGQPDPVLAVTIQGVEHLPGVTAPVLDVPELAQDGQGEPPIVPGSRDDGTVSDEATHADPRDVPQDETTPQDD